MQPEKFSLITDFATYKNDSRGSLSLVLPSGLFIPANGVYEVKSSMVIGVEGASERGQIYSSKINKRFPTSILNVNRSGFTDFGDSPYTIICEMYRTASNELTFSISILNPYNLILLTEFGDETFTFYANTFLPPFP